MVYSGWLNSNDLSWAYQPNATLSFDIPSSETGIDELTGNPIITNTTVEIHACLRRDQTKTTVRDFAGENEKLEFLSGRLLDPVPLSIANQSLCRLTITDSATNLTQAGEFVIVGLLQMATGGVTSALGAKISGYFKERGGTNPQFFT